MREELEAKDKAFMLIKHEAIQRNLIGSIIKRIERKGLKIIAIKMLVLSRDDAKKFLSFPIF